MEKMQAAAAVNENHKQLQKLVGTWTTVSRMWMEPGKPPVETTGTAEVKSILGDRYVEEHHAGTFMGKPFNGQGMTGYDNLRKKYVSTWVDNAGTGIMRMEGSYDAAKKTMTMIAEEIDPMSGKLKPFKITDTFDSDKQHTFAMFEAGPDGKEVKSFEIIYTRK